MIYFNGEKQQDMFQSDDPGFVYSIVTLYSKGIEQKASSFIVTGLKVELAQKELIKHLQDNKCSNILLASTTRLANNIQEYYERIRKS